MFLDSAGDRNLWGALYGSNFSPPTAPSPPPPSPGEFQVLEVRIEAQLESVTYASAGGDIKII